MAPNILGEIVDPVAVFGHAIRRLRKTAGLTQEQLALAAEIERNFVSLIERGISQPTVRTVFRLALALETTPSEIFKEVEDKVLSSFDGCVGSQLRWMP